MSEIRINITKKIAESGNYKLINGGFFNLKIKKK